MSRLVPSALVALLRNLGTKVSDLGCKLVQKLEAKPGRPRQGRDDIFERGLTGLDGSEIAHASPDRFLDALNKAALNGVRVGHTTPPSSVTGTPEGTAPATTAPVAGPYNQDGRR